MSSTLSPQFLKSLSLFLATCFLCWWGGEGPLGGGETLGEEMNNNMIDEELLLKIKQVSLPEILASFDILPQHHKDPDSGRKCYLYRAPDRDDLHPSVSVFNRRIDGIWLWKDHATGKTGTNLDLLVGFNLFQDWREAAAFIAHDYLHIDINSKMPRLLPAVIQQPYKRDKHLTDDAKILSVRSVICPLPPNSEQ